MQVRGDSMMAGEEERGWIEEERNQDWAAFETLIKLIFVIHL